MKPGLQPWSKAGIIIKASTRPGSAYAAMMVTGRHGVRLQDNFTQDTAGLPGAVSVASPRGLRLTRSADTLTGYDSADGVHWTRVGAATLAGLPATVPADLFAASPGYTVVPSQSFGGSSSKGAPSQATGVFDHVSMPAASSGGGWTGTDLGGAGPPTRRQLPYPGEGAHRGARDSRYRRADRRHRHPRPGLGAVLRRSAGAVTAVIAVIVLPYLLATAGFLPAGASEWLLRITPAAAFAVQQTVPQYPQVTAAYTPSDGYYPLSPWAGFAVLCAWAVLALGLAIFLLRRRDA